MNTCKINDIHRHSYDLGRVFGELAQPYEFCFYSVQEWLHIASGVMGVDFDSGRFDTCWMYCKNIGEYEDKKSELLSSLIHQLTTFNFIWGSLETLNNIINPEPAPGVRGKINATCYFLKNHYEPKPNLPFYNNVVSDLREDICSNVFYKKLNAEFKLRPHVGVSSIGLYIVYKIRNHFAHGSLSLPEPDLDASGQQESSDWKIINLSSRVVLLTIQALLLTILEKESAKIDFYNEETELNNLLWHLHLQHETDENQLSFKYLQEIS
jgi:hypothetical protein